jgi:serine/threonine protein phosphatase 1
VALCGNHEEVLRRLLEGEQGLLEQWLHFGGDSCVRSYGANPAELRSLSEGEALRRLRELIPAGHWHFMADMADTFRFGDYLFVHAGLRPGVPLDDQTPRDLRWIREAFLDDPRDHGMVVVHGHTISETAEQRPNRIGIDTGAYHSGVLTALGVDHTGHWLLQSGKRSPDQQEQA